MKRILPVFSLIFLLIISCSKKEEKMIDFNKGKITILTDDSFKSLVEALADAYMIRYPQTEVSVEVMKEDFALSSLMKNEAKLIAISKPLTEKEKSEYEQIMETKFQPDYFAADAVLFITHKNSARESISVEEIKAELLSDKKNFVFDGNNSSNLNFISDKIGHKPSELKYYVMNGNENVIQTLEKHPDKIGVISLNTISRQYNKEMQELRNSVKILPVQSEGQRIFPEGKNLTEMKYPFTRLIYFLYNEGGFGIAKGIVRFSCTQKGQLVVEKEGLQPYNLYKREVRMN